MSGKGGEPGPGADTLGEDGLRVELCCRRPRLDSPDLNQEVGCKTTRKREFKLPWREAGPLNDHSDKVDSTSKMTKWIRASRLPIMTSLSPDQGWRDESTRMREVQGGERRER